MIPVPSGSRIWLATEHTDLHKRFDGLAALVQDHQARDPFLGQSLECLTKLPFAAGFSFGLDSAMRAAQCLTSLSSASGGTL